MPVRGGEEWSAEIRKYPPVWLPGRTALVPRRLGKIETRLPTYVRSMELNGSR